MICDFSLFLCRPWSLETEKSLMKLFLVFHYATLRVYCEEVCPKRGSLPFSSAVIAPTCIMLLGRLGVGRLLSIISGLLDK